MNQKNIVETIGSWELSGWGSGTRAECGVSCDIAVRDNYVLITVDRRDAWIPREVLVKVLDRMVTRPEGE